jgi:lipopolysaccharide/colanic/teichoic acid biosynthesis glycosyltransferase
MTAGTANAGDGFYMSRANSLRVTRAGRFMRRYHLDELPQLIDILLGDMTFVGTRPEVPEYVDAYTPEMYATLLLPAGLTSEASIQFQDEGMLAEKAEDANAFYVRVILPKKMDINLRQLKEFSLAKDFACLVNTVRSIGKA